MLIHGQSYALDLKKNKMELAQNLNFESVPFCCVNVFQMSILFD